MLHRGYCYAKKLGLANGKAAANLLRREKRKGISNIPKHRNEKLKATRSPDRKADTMDNIVVSAFSEFPPQLVKTILCDRGTEFAKR